MRNGRVKADNDNEQRMLFSEHTSKTYCGLWLWGPLRRSAHVTRPAHSNNLRGPVSPFFQFQSIPIFFTDISFHTLMGAYPSLKHRLASLLVDESTADVTFLVGEVGLPNLLRRMNAILQEKPPSELTRKFSRQHPTLSRT